MKISTPILIVEDDELQREMLQTLLMRKLGFSCFTAINGRDALNILAQDSLKEIRLVILDIRMPVMGGLETLDIINQQYPDIGVIMLSGSKDIDDAVQALKKGALDFLNKPFESERMITTVRNAMKMGILSREVKRLSNEKEKRFGFDHLIGCNDGLAYVTAQGRKAAGTNIPVLITGETGTGKEVFALSLHGESARAQKPFIAINCGAIPHQLAESVLFGHEKGAFTGATDNKLGKFREAEGGTIFLDEIGELPLDAQVKLLRVLQQREVEPVGAGKPVPVDIRIISATNRNLEDDIKNGKFREDLYYRLNVIHIELPSLNQRKNDIPALALHFAERFSARENAVPKILSTNLLDYLQNKNWPGNVRELENTIHRIIAMSEKSTLGLADIDPQTMHNSKSEDISRRFSELSDASIGLINNAGIIKSLEKIEQEAIRWTLNHHHGNVTQAARSLGMAKSTFYKKIR